MSGEDDAFRETKGAKVVPLKQRNAKRRRVRTKCSEPKGVGEKGET